MSERNLADVLKVNDEGVIAPRTKWSDLFEDIVLAHPEAKIGHCVVCGSAFLKKLKTKSEYGPCCDPESK